MKWYWKILNLLLKQTKFEWKYFIIPHILLLVGYIHWNEPPAPQLKYCNLKAEHVLITGTLQKTDLFPIYILIRFDSCFSYCIQACRRPENYICAKNVGKNENKITNAIFIYIYDLCVRCITVALLKSFSKTWLLGFIIIAIKRFALVCSF